MRSAGTINHRPITPLRNKIYWLDAPHGRVTIGAGAVHIGRSPDCTIVLEGPRVSRYHAVVRLSEEGVELLPLGREPVRVNGVEKRSLTTLRTDDAIELCGWTFRVGEGESDAHPGEGRVTWFLERQSGLLHYVRGPSFRVGGDACDDLTLLGWEPSVFSLDLGAEPTLTALRQGVRCGRILAVHDRVVLTDGARISYRDDSLTVRSRPTQVLDPTAPSSGAGRSAARAELEFLPRGGRLTVVIDGQTHTTTLSERRCDLVACLLKPPAPFAPGEIIPEDVLCARVWPGEKNGRIELNSLLFRLRHALAEQGIDSAALFERRSGGLRFCLAPDATVIVR